ncbi:PREDICTED: Fanconi anemia group J protein-like isoform X2 [Dinoponera quadriceps]|uniref:DNA 5'-3' helicase n=1 Tax=Dinoponera quadriceps TaxID=609295 RepID=A0A6P3X0N5_DINQU|nr:PREDICTED: Fanconi anemia group J protein-like isoform X2 [Dinoponera quadriceps]
MATTTLAVNKPSTSYWHRKISADLNQSMDMEDFSGDDAFCNLPVDPDKQCDKSKKIPRIPKIFYGTRTHKQIAQIVRELKKTAYRNKRMTVLSSRDHTCIQESNRNKNELCNELLDPKKRTKCPYYNEQNKRNMASFETVQRLGLRTPWDIEDLLSLGKRIGACPYFAARSLMADAEIVMCPYNYIIDPNIRESMQINLKGNVIILDEAHNIEDICREVASVDIKDTKLVAASEECEILSHNRKVNENMYTTIYTYLRKFVQFLTNVDVKDNANDNHMVSKEWLGMELLEVLNMEQIGHSAFPLFLAASRAAIQDFTSMRETFSERAIPTITLDAKTVLENLCFAIEMISSESYVNDYKAYVVEVEEYRAACTKAADDVWVSMRNKRQRVRVLKLVCMNPAVIFAPIARTARSVILASGTLSPVSSFESELGTRFPHKLHANHVISREQVYVRCISRGPAGEALKATYENVNDWTFMKGLGNLIVQVCDAVPYGVLCFFSSYPTMHKIHNRWKDTGIWAQLEQLKKIFVEPKTTKELDEVMRQYHRAIDESSSDEKSGAILFAIFRGKVAEGTDFSDNEARCVLTVGIPFSNIKDKSICMKKDYNNSNASKGLLSGSEWFTVHAFRALNQALGRCIRHKDDWGAVLLVDVRLQRELYRKNFEYLPKWIREMWKDDSNYDLQGELGNFVAGHVARERGRMYLEEKKAQGSYKTSVHGMD